MCRGKTLKQEQLLMYLQGMRRDVRQFVVCMQCQISKSHLVISELGFTMLKNNSCLRGHSCYRKRT